jgi:hypothetical protein
MSDRWRAGYDHWKTTPAAPEPVRKAFKMADRPVVHVTNWSSKRLHGPGRKLTIMARPRAWEHGDGRVPAATPHPQWLEDVRSGAIDFEFYATLIRTKLTEAPHRPGELVAIVNGAEVLVADGDTLCCACSRDEAAAGRCHRVPTAQALAAAGWAVVLDGVPC